MTAICCMQELAQYLKNYRGERFSIQSLLELLGLPLSADDLMADLKQLQSIHPEIQIEDDEIYWEE